MNCKRALAQTTMVRWQLMRRITNQTKNGDSMKL